MAKRTRIDSAKGSTEIMKDALSGAPNPPNGVNISAAVLPFWEIVTTAKAKRAWTRNDLVLAADIARSMYRLEVVSVQLETYLAYSLVGADIDPDAEIPDTKEMEKLADTLSKRIKLLSAHLQIHTEATQGKSREQVEQNKAHRGAQEFADSPKPSDLINRPTH
tara:strand:- start:10365 stop:10856 length:492 start_codon:yes stop_codon:yes gene_type:complete